MEGQVITIVDVKAELGKLTMLRGRRPEMTEADRKGTNAFATLTPFRDGNIFSAKFSGNGAWERHPNGDELVQVVEGTTTLHIMTDEGPQTHALKAGMLVIVPQAMWHRFEAPDGVCLMTATPKPTEHLTVDVEDPRTLSAAQKSDATEEKWR
jgi:mannose-6-phosphate isomerase-like protein (cupin superfamily)